MKNNLSRRSFGNHWLTAFALLLLVSLSALAQEPNPNWQSPINFEFNSLAYQNLPPLNFNYRSGVPLNVINTGSPGEFANVRANVPAGAGSLTVEGVTYNLVQFHWHTAAEHLVDGTRFPLEMHLVHQAQDGSLMVVGVWLTPGRRNLELDKIFSQLPPTSANSVPVASFSLPLLLPRNRQSFRYIGSLTAPPFTPGVRWAVFAQPLEVSVDQILAYRRLFPNGNAREVQPLNGRLVTFDIGN